MDCPLIFVANSLEMTQIAVRMSATSSLASKPDAFFATSPMGLFLLSRRSRRFYFPTDSWKAIFPVISGELFVNQAGHYRLHLPTDIWDAFFLPHLVNFL